jgi:hypothetical protein
VTAARPFVVGLLPELNEQEPNNGLSERQSIERLPVTINGVLGKRKDVDVFMVSLPAGATLVASVDAQRSLQSPVDACLQIVSEPPRTGTGSMPNRSAHVLAQNLDARGLDPRLTYRAARHEVVSIRIFGFPATPDSTIGFAGGDDYAYRLTLTTGGFLEGCLPLADDHRLEARLLPVGFNFPPSETLRCVRLAHQDWAVVFGSDPATANAVRIPIRPIPSVSEVPGSTLDHPQPLEIPCIVSGQLQDAGERDVYRWLPNKGTKYELRLESQVMDYRLDGVLTLLDDKGARIARADDAEKQPDPQFDWQATADGPVRLVVSDLHDHGGQDYLYRVTIEEERPRFTTSVKQDIFRAKAGETLEVPIQIKRLSGFADPIRFTVSDLPSGSVVGEAISESSGDSSKQVKLAITIKSAWIGPIRIQASVSDRPELTQAVNPQTAPAPFWLIATD